MAHAPAAAPPASAIAGGSEHPASAHHQAPLTAGKVAMWLFLATEIMFFTGLIGSYIVLRMGSPADAYSNLYSPGYLQTTGNELARLSETKGVLLSTAGENHSGVAEALHHFAGLSEEDAHHLVESTPVIVTEGMPEADAAKLRDALIAAGGQAQLEELKTYDWPLPYDHATNPLSIDLTAANTFVLICSSVTMVLALGAIQRGDKKKLTMYLVATTLIGATFLGVQVFEYYELMRGHLHPIGISKSGHFTPNASLFASCFFTMTGFHGAHVAGGVISLACLVIGSLMGKFTKEHHAPVELIGLYWHFVDLVWILLFTVVYLI